MAMAWEVSFLLGNASTTYFTYSHMFLQVKYDLRSNMMGALARSCTSILRVILSPANQVQYPHFTTCVRGLCHGITPLFLPADVPGTPLALYHAACCLAKRVSRRGSEAIQVSAVAQALQ